LGLDNGHQNVNSVAAGGNHSLTIKSDGTVWGWGANNFGQLGDGSGLDQSMPVQMRSNIAPQVAVVLPSGTQGTPTETSSTKPIVSWTQTDAALTIFTGYQVQILDAAGTTVVVDSGVMPQNTTANSASWTVAAPLPTNQNFQVRVKVSDGVVWSDWSNPAWMKVVPSFTQGPMVKAGLRHSLVLKNDGTVWPWGTNSDGQLGDGTKTTRAAAVQVPNLTKVVAISAGGYHSLALKSDGTVWAWGSGNGVGKATSSATPVQIAVSGVTAISAGYEFSLVLKSDGAVWAWGLNDYKQLGDTTTTNRLSPVQVQGLSSVAEFAAGRYDSLAVKLDGTVWKWGSSNSSLYQFSNLTGVKKVTVGENHYAVLKTDGTMWTWGTNTSGQLGNGTTTSRGTPALVTSISDVKNISAGESHTLALKNDGTLWAWGFNYFAQLGDGTTTDRSTPVQMH
jgi:alpha-tubulin suppressor-like RCC1 family protein